MNVPPDLSAGDAAEDTNAGCPQCGAGPSAGLLGGLCSACAAKGLLSDLESCDPDSGMNSGNEDLVQVGEFELIEVLGRGGAGVVYRARQARLGREVALKVLSAGPFADDESRGRFLAEAQVAAGLDHPHIVPVYGFGEAGGRLYCAMRLMPGGNLADAIRADLHEQVSDAPSDLRFGRIANLMIRIARAVQYAHERGIIHRDLKPANILLDDGGEPRVADFGLAKRDSMDPGLTQTGTFLGTPAYMAPEQMAEQGGVTTATDVWGLGAILFELLSGRPAFVASNIPALVRAVAEEEPARPLSLRDEHRTAAAETAGWRLAPGRRVVDPEMQAGAVSDALPDRSKSLFHAVRMALRFPTVAHRRRLPLLARDLETICLKCLSKNPTARYPTAGGMADDLARALDGQSIAARPVGAMERMQRWCLRRPGVAVLAVFLVLAILLLAVGGPVAAVRIAALRNQALHERQSAQRTADRLEIAALFERLGRHDAPGGLAMLARRLRRDPASLADADRALSLLTLQPFAVPDPESLVSLASTASLWGNGQRGIVKVDADSGRLELWDLLDKRRIWEGTNAGLYQKAHLAFDPLGRWFVLPAEPNQLEVRQVHDGRAIARFRSVNPGDRRMTFSADGRWLAVGGEVEQTLVVDTSTWVPVMALDQDTNSLDLLYPPRVEAMDFTTDGTHLATGSFGGRVDIWTVPRGRRMASFNLSGLVTSVRFSAQGRFLCASGKGEVGVWNMETQQLIRKVTIPGRQQTWATVTPDGRSLVILTAGGLFRREDLQEPGSDVASTQHALLFGGGDFSDNGSILRAIVEPRGVVWLDVADGRIRAQIPSSPNIVQIWPERLGRGAEVRMMLAERAINSAAKSTASHRSRESMRKRPETEGTSTKPETGLNPVSEVAGRVSFRGWTPPSLAPPEIRLEHDSDVVSVTFSPDSQWLASVGWDGEVRLWRLSGDSVVAGPRIDRGRALGRRAWRACFSPDSTLLATTGWDSWVELRELGRGSAVHTLVQPGMNQWWVEFTPDGRRLLTAGGTPNLSDGATAPVLGWDPIAGGTLFHSSAFQFCWEPALSPDGTRWAIPDASLAPPDQPGRPGSVMVIDTLTGGEVMPRLEVPLSITLKRLIRSVSFSGDGRWLAAGGVHHAFVWDARNGERKWRLPHPEIVRAVRFHPDGRRMLTAGEDGFARLWDLQSGRPWRDAVVMHHSLGSHHSLYEGVGVRVARFSPDGRWIATGAADHTARLWDAATGHPISIPLRHDGPVLDLQFSLDGRWLVTASADRTARLWRLSRAATPIPEWLPDLLEGIALRRITDDEQVEPVPVEQLFETRRRVTSAEQDAVWTRAIPRYLALPQGSAVGASR